MKPFALDIGDRYIGIAATDHVSPNLAYRYATIDRKTQDAFSAIANAVQQEHIDTLILGVPYHVEDGSETNQTRKTREFIALLKEKLGDGVLYVEVDETLTSHSAREHLQQEGKGMEEEHAEAARLMLVEYLAKAQ